MSPSKRALAFEYSKKADKLSHTARSGAQHALAWKAHLTAARNHEKALHEYKRQGLTSYATVHEMMLNHHRKAAEQHRFKSGQDFNILGRAALPGGHAGYGRE